MSYLIDDAENAVEVDFPAQRQVSNTFSTSGSDASAVMQVATQQAAVAGAVTVSLAFARAMMERLV